MTNRKSIFYGLGIFIALLLIYFIYYIREPLLEILQPIFFALIITYLLNPLISGLELKKISRTLSIIIIYIIVIIGVSITLFFILPRILRSITDLIEAIPQFLQRYEILFYEFVIRYRNSDLPLRIIDMLDQNIYHIEQVIINSLEEIVSLITGVFYFLFDFILGGIIAFYFLKDIKEFKRALVSIIPRKGRKGILGVVRDIDVVLGGFIRGQLLVAAILGIITMIGLSFIGVKYSFILGGVAGIANIIPYFGPIIGIIPAAIVAFFDKPVNGMWVILMYFILQQLESAILTPKIVGSRVGLHPAITIIAVIVGGKFFGIIGLILAVPIVGILKVLGIRIVKSIV